MKKNMKKTARVTSLVMASLLCLSACGKQPAGNSSDDVNPATNSSSVVESTQEEEAKPYWELLDEVSDTSDLPDWDGETLEITVWHASGTDALSGEIAENDIVYKEFERVTGVKFNVEDSFGNGGNNIDAKLPMVIGSGDLPNMILGYDIGKQTSELFENGYLADLTDYYVNGDLDQVTKWLPMDKTDTFVYKNARTENGEYYLIPQLISNNKLTQVWSSANYYPDEAYDNEYHNTYGVSPTGPTGLTGSHTFWVRDDILKELKPDALTWDELANIYIEKGTFTEEEIYSLDLNSAEEFYDFLRDIKELLAGGDYVGLDGKPMEVTYGGHTETDNWWLGVYWPGLLKGFNGDYFSLVNKAATNESEVLQWAFSSEFYVDHWKDLNTLIREDVISQNSFLDNAASFKEKLNNLHYAVAYVQSMPSIVKNANSEVGYSPIWVNVPFNTELGGVSAVSITEFYGIFKDTLTEEELDQLIHAINYLNSVVGMNNFFWGPKTAGLFEEDAEGNRTFIDEELHNNMVLRQDNEAALKNGGLFSYLAKDKNFVSRPRGVVEGLLTPAYLARGNMARLETDAITRYTPGILDGMSTADHTIYVNVAPIVYGTYLSKVKGLEEFWAARNGFEDLVKKVYVAKTDEEFDKQLQALIEYTEEYGLTDETLKEYNDMFVKDNKEPLKNAGIIK